MTCREMDTIIRSHSGDSTPPPEAARHVVECEGCRLLVNALDKAHNGLEPSAGRLKQIQAAINEDLRPVRPLASSRVFLLTFMLISLLAVVLGSFLLGRSGWDALSRVQRTIVFTAVTASAILLATSVVRQMAPGGKHSLSPRLLPVGILALQILVIAAVFRVRHESAFVPDGLVCLRTGLTYSIPAAFLFCLLLSRGAIMYPKLIGAAAGGLAGLIGLSVLEVQCPNLNEYHILVWHWGVILLSSAGGLSLGAAAEYIRQRGDHRSSRI